MPAPSRIIFINRFYHPSTVATSQLLTDLAEGLVAIGHRVWIICARHDATLPTTTEHNGVHITRIQGAQRGKSISGRLLDFAGFICETSAILKNEVTANDTVVCLTDPPLAGTFFTRIVMRKGARMIHWVQDIYPELINQAGIGPVSQPLVALLRIFRDRSWRNSHTCVTLGQDMAGLLRSRGVPENKIRILPNWPPLGLQPPPSAACAKLREEWGIKARLLVMYSGNLGRVHDLEPCLETARQLRDENDIAFVFVGGGARKITLERQARDWGLNQVHFVPFQPRDRLSLSLGAGDVHWVTLREGCEPLVYPSKLYGIAAVGRPVLFVGNPRSGIAREIVQNGFGIAHSRQDADKMARQLIHWKDEPTSLLTMGEQAQFFARKNSFDHTLAQWQALLQEVNR